MLDMGKYPMYRNVYIPWFFRISLRLSHRLHSSMGYQAYLDQCTKGRNTVYI